MKLYFLFIFLGNFFINYCSDSPSNSAEYKEISLNDDNQKLPYTKKLSSSQKINARQESSKEQKKCCNKCLFFVCSPFMYCTYACRK